MVAILVVLTIVAFVLVDAMVQRAETKRQQAPQHSSPASRAVPALAFEGACAPNGVFMDPGHTWVGLEASGKTQVGMDDFAQRAIGRIDKVELPAVGKEVRQGETLFAIRQGDRRAAFVSPIDGFVQSNNRSLEQNSEKIKTDPFHAGWICVLTPKNLAKNLRRLSIAEEAKAWHSREMLRFQEFITSRPIEDMALGQVLQDGGQPIEGLLELMDEETWRQFSRSFLRN